MILSMSSYHFLVKEIPKWDGNYLEIGVWEGDMLRDFAERWPQKTFYGIDPFLSDCDTTGHTGVPIGQSLDAHRVKANENFNLCPNIEFFEQTSESFSMEHTNAQLEEMNISVVYVDGSHTCKNTLIDLDIAARAVKEGLIYVHDYDLPAVLQATNLFISLNKDRISEHDKHCILLK